MCQTVKFVRVFSLESSRYIIISICLYQLLDRCIEQTIQLRLSKVQLLHTTRGPIFTYTQSRCRDCRLVVARVERLCFLFISCPLSWSFTDNAYLVFALLIKHMLPVLFLLSACFQMLEDHLSVITYQTIFIQQSSKACT